MARPGAKVMLVGIPYDDKLQLTHSTARRKGLSLIVSRRMKHTYPRAIRLAQSAVDLDDLISHHFPLEQTPEAFRVNAEYQPGVHKIIIDVSE
jgi:L-iditol 2-dehydrogenase